MCFSNVIGFVPKEGFIHNDKPHKLITELYMLSNVVLYISFLRYTNNRRWLVHILL